MPTNLPIRSTAGRKSDGFCTPTEDKTPQKMRVPPRRVLPIVFLPGIMGSNLRLSAERQSLLFQQNNVAWRPDDIEHTGKMAVESPVRRQLTLDPLQTTVDVYDPVRNPTGDKNETVDSRNSAVALSESVKYEEHSPLLSDDPECISTSRTSVQKALERGWGEVYFASYGPILEKCEQSFNSVELQKHWAAVIGHDPSEWGAVTALPALTNMELNAVLKGTFFPVHAMGYNWLRSNAESAETISERIRALIAKYKRDGYVCEKVIILTHSMGGLVARALIHPEIGALSTEVLGVVHGVMPACGAPATYRRMRCGFEAGEVKKYIGAKILGSVGSMVTAVLGNSPGGLELLPSKAYGNGWLQVRYQKSLFISLPRNGDPYSEIYKDKESWFNLLMPQWLNPAKMKDASLERTHAYLDAAKRFHDAIDQTYHPLSYAHYGSDPDMPSWEHIGWTLSQNFPRVNWTKLKIESDNEQGSLQLLSPDETVSIRDRKGLAKLAPSAGSGDSTVPTRSADHQLFSKKFKGIFKQTGYEHQDSYRNPKVQNATLYSIVRIAQEMVWSSHV